MITGPTANICDDCVGTCVDMLKEAAMGDPGDGQPDATDPDLGALLSCALCGLPVYSEEATLIPNRGAICSGCLSEVQAAAAEKEI